MAVLRTGSSTKLGFDTQIYEQRPTTIIFESISAQPTTLTLPELTVNVCCKSIIAFFEYCEGVCILQPKSAADSRRYVAAEDRSGSGSTVIAVCSSDGEEDPDDELKEHWTWDGIHTWENGFDLPPMIPGEVLCLILSIASARLSMCKASQDSKPQFQNDAY